MIVAFLLAMVLQGGLTHAQTLPADFNDALVLGGWSGPVGCVWDANERMYVWEKRGRVWVVEDGVRLPNPLINIDQEVGNWADHGLLGFALDPAFLTNGRIYLLYTVDRHHLMNFGTPAYEPFVTEGNAATILRIVRYTALGPEFTTVDPASRTVLLGETAQTGVPVLYNTHGPGSLVFGTDGTLLASVGEGASAAVMDIGSAAGSYWAQGLADGIIRPEENVGAFRAQMVNSLNGKVLRLDPETGNGIPSNPFYEAGDPRAPKSRVWAMGLRNPYRMTLEPGTGETDPALGRPGVLHIGDVGWSTWEELNVCYEGGMNFGWPLFEGMEPQPSYAAASVANQDHPNPLFDGISCTIQHFRFNDLLVQDTPVHLNGHPNPCDGQTQVPASVPRHFHARPVIDWDHDNRSRSGGFEGNQAVTYDLDAPDAPVPGPRFGGYAAIAGPSAQSLILPAAFQTGMFHADYAAGWIKQFRFTANNAPESVHDFASGLGAVNWLGAGPDGCLWYIRYNAVEIRRICYTLAVDLPPIAVATPEVSFGPAPLSVQFSSAGSIDPEGGPITVSWDFGDGSPLSSALAPMHVFEAPSADPVSYTVTLTVSDAIGQQVSEQVLVSLNNTPPQVNIASIPQDGTYPVGIDTTYQLEALVVDTEHGPGALSYAWVTTLSHNTHEHPGTPDGSPVTSTVISGVGCDGDTHHYTITLTVTDAAGLSGSSQRRLDPRCQAIAPTAVITASKTFGYGPLAVDLDGTASFDPGQIVAFHWSFGDGTFSTSPTLEKVFTGSGEHQVTLTVTDNDGLIGQATRVITVLTLDPPQCVGPVGTLLREQWNNITGIAVLDLTSHPLYPDSPSSSGQLSAFQGPTNAGSNYGARIRGYIVPPVSGEYTFTATSDNASVVYMSPNSDPFFKQVICSVPIATAANAFTVYPSQTSAPVYLEAGAYYYVEMLHKEGSSSDHCALYWQTPLNGTRTIIPGAQLAPWVECTPGVRLRVFLQGAFNSEFQLMDDDLRVAGLLPLTEPYTALGFNTIGNTATVVDPARLSINGKNAVVDWVLVELRNKYNPAQIMATTCALVERDGDVVGVDGFSKLLFNVPSDQYHVAIRHRNHLGAMSSMPVVVGTGTVVYDLTRADTPVFGDQSTAVLPSGLRTLWAGNTTRDGYLRYTGILNDRDPILQRIGGATPTATASGYHVTDVNMDGWVRYTGSMNDRDPILVNIGGFVPTAVRAEQLP